MAARLAMRTYDCRSRTPRFLASRVSPLIAACKSFASVGKVMSLGCTVVSTVTRAKSFVRSAALSCATRRLSARRSSSLPPRRLRQAQVRALVRKLVLEQKKPDHKLCRNPGPPLSLYSGAISPSMKSQSILPYVDDLVQPRAEQITRSCRLVLLRPHRSPPMRRPNHASRFEGIAKRNCKLPGPQTRKPGNLKSPKLPKSTLAQWVGNSSRATPH